MNTSVKLTVAMAVYNASEFLGDAIKNIQAQDFQDFEFLIIDDGSTDGSRTIIKTYAASDDRIRYIFKDKNEGLSSVRNMSISEAHGEYLIMIDADDIFESDALSKMLNMAEKESADVVICDYDTFTGTYTRRDDTVSKLNDYGGASRSKLLFLPAFMPIRMIRTSYARQRNINFPLGLTKQDIPVHWKIITDENARISILPEKLFHYRQHDSATSQRKGKSLFSLAKVMDIVGEQLNSEGKFDEYKPIYYRKRFSLLHGMYDAINPEYKEEALRMIRERLDDDSSRFVLAKDNGLSRRVRLFYQALNGNVVARFFYSCIISARTVYRKLH